MVRETQSCARRASAQGGVRRSRRVRHFLLRGRRFGQDVTQALRGVVVGRVKFLRAAECRNRRNRVAFRDRFVSLAQLDRGNLLPETLRGCGVNGIVWRDGQGSLQLLQRLLELAVARQFGRRAVKIVCLLVVRAGDAAGGETFIVVGAGWCHYAGRRILSGLQSAWEQHCRQQERNRPEGTPKQVPKRVPKQVPKHKPDFTGFGSPCVSP